MENSNKYEDMIYIFAKLMKIKLRTLEDKQFMDNLNNSIKIQDLIKITHFFI